MAWSLIGMIGDNFEVHGNVLKGLCWFQNGLCAAWSCSSCFRASEFLRHISPLRASSLAICFDMLKKQDKCSRRGHCSWLVIYEHSADYCENAGNMPGNLNGLSVPEWINWRESFLCRKPSASRVNECYLGPPGPLGSVSQLTLMKHEQYKLSISTVVKCRTEL